MAPIDCSRDSAEAWNIPPLMMFTIYNREIYLNISSESSSLENGAVQKIKDLFGSNVCICELKLQNIVFTTDVVALVGHFGITKLELETEGIAFSQDIESLGMVVPCPSGTSFQYNFRYAHSNSSDIKTLQT